MLISAALGKRPTPAGVLDGGHRQRHLGDHLAPGAAGSRAVGLDVSLGRPRAGPRERAPARGLGRLIARRLGDWLTALAGVRFDLVARQPAVSHPRREEPALSPTVRDHDPRMALFAGEDGLAAIRQLLDDAAGVSGAGRPLRLRDRLRTGRRRWRGRSARAGHGSSLRIQPDLRGPRSRLWRSSRAPLHPVADTSRG